MNYTVSVGEAVAELDRFDALIDVRSPAEFAEDHIPGALNWPVLDDRERHDVGLLYATSPFEARKLGAALVARNIARHIEASAAGLPKTWRPLVYCWRGGQRSGALAHVLGQVGFRISIVQGGYKALRAALVRDNDAMIARARLAVICGPTGCGKSRLLQALHAHGAQVLDLEALAVHRGSVLGAVPGLEQPTQKQFETRVWDALRRFDLEQPVYVEAESRKIGRVQLPGTLYERMAEGTCLRLQAELPVRVRILLDDYAALTRDVAELEARLDALVTLRGRETVTRWRTLARAGAFDTLVEELLAQHYDPSYRGSSTRHFPDFDTARSWTVPGADAAAFDTLAATMLRDLDAS